jgi:hypothetical protein
VTHRRGIQILVSIAMLLALPVGATAVPCDPAGADAAALADSRNAIDAACPCASAVSRSAHVRCAKPVVDQRITGGLLSPQCRRDALRHAKLSICGMPGSVVCCRVKTTGRTSHKVFKHADKCVATPKTTACISTWESVPSGCNPTGCVPPESVCGNGIVEGDEECDPPTGTTCDAECQTVECPAPPSACGNGTLDPGEACEPPAIGTCGVDCQAASCTAPAVGETAISCVAGSATVGAGSDGSGYLVAWTGAFHRAQTELLARRLDADAAGSDPVLTLTEDAACGSAPSRPAVASDGNGYMLAWSTFGPYGPTFFNAIHARPVAADDTFGVLEQLAFTIPFGQCQTAVSGPTAAAATGPAAYASLWVLGGGCFGGPVFQDPDGVLLAFAGGPADPADRTSTDVGYGVPTLPGAWSSSAASVGSTGADTLAVWHAALVHQLQPLDADPIVAAEWIAPDGTSTKTSLGSRRLPIAGRPAVAAGPASFLVAWAQGATDDATVVTEIRGLRATHAAGSLDPDGGMLLASTAGGAVKGGPVAAFDGTGWMVAWSEAGSGGNDLRAVAVDQDGTIADPMPRLIASGVADGDPAVASTGDGRTLVVYVRPDGAASAVRAQLVTR